MDTYTGMVLAALIFVASLASVELGISAAIIEITLGVLAGNLIHVRQLDWVKYIASFGGRALFSMGFGGVRIAVGRRAK